MARRTAQLKIPVRFNNVSIQQTTARIGIKIDRTSLGLSEADNFLCGHRLSCRVQTIPKNEDSKQKHMFDGGKHTITGVCDVKKIGISPDELSAGLTFSLKDLESEHSELLHFSKRQGQLEVFEISAITKDEAPAEADDDADDDEGEDDGEE